MTDDRKVHRIHKWKWGHDPQDPDTHPDSGWEYVTIDPKPKPAPPKRPTSGADTGVTCFRCKNNTYRAVKESGHKDPYVMLICPKCRDRQIILKSVIMRLHRQEANR